MWFITQQTIRWFAFDEHEELQKKNKQLFFSGNFTQNRWNWVLESQTE